MPSAIVEALSKDAMKEKDLGEERRGEEVCLIYVREAEQLTTSGSRDEGRTRISSLSFSESNGRLRETFPRSVSLWHKGHVPPPSFPTRKRAGTDPAMHGRARGRESEVPSPPLRDVLSPRLRGY